MIPFQMKSSHSLGLILCVLVVIADGPMAQEMIDMAPNFSIVQDSARRDMWGTPLWKYTTAIAGRLPFDTVVDFSNSRFQCPASFQHATFCRTANFSNTEFDSAADFTSTHFGDYARFTDTKFRRLADFGYAGFQDRADFSLSTFGRDAEFHSSIFDSVADFEDSEFFGCAGFVDATFGDTARFWRARFNDTAKAVQFRDAHFIGPADFGYAEFNQDVGFDSADFEHSVTFQNARFHRDVNFRHADFKGKIDFRGAEFDSTIWVDFSDATIRDTVFIGSRSNTNQGYNFLWAKLSRRGMVIEVGDTASADTSAAAASPGDTAGVMGDTASADTSAATVSPAGAAGVAGNTDDEKRKAAEAKIILDGLARLKIQREKLKFVALCDTLGYYRKQSIIETLKEVSFAEDKHKRERFELEYMLAKSTMFQKKSDEYETYSLIHPARIKAILYYATMGLGYRPFWMLLWFGVVVVVYAVVLSVVMGNRINQYVTNGEGPAENPTGKSENGWTRRETMIHCCYFSAMVFFSVRLKRELLGFFKGKQKVWIVSEWSIGLAAYAAFLILSEEGSIVYTLVNLFVG